MLCTPISSRLTTLQSCLSLACHFTKADIRLFGVVDSACPGLVGANPIYVLLVQGLDCFAAHPGVGGMLVQGLHSALYIVTL